MRIACKFRSSCPEMFYKNSSSEHFGIFSEQNLCFGTNLIKCRMKNHNFSKTALHHKSFLGEFPKCQEQQFCGILQNSSLSIWSLYWMLDNSTISFPFIKANLIIAPTCISSVQPQVTIEYIETDYICLIAFTLSYLRT